MPSASSEGECGAARRPLSTLEPSRGDVKPSAGRQAGKDSLAGGEIALVAARGRVVKMGGPVGQRTVFLPAARSVWKGTGGMDALNSWDVALFAVAGYIAIVSLVRLMLGRRAALARQVREELERRESQARAPRARKPSGIVLAQPPRPQPALLAKKKA